MDLAIHDIDIMFWLMGEKRESVGVTKKVITDNDDIFNAIIEFRNGVIGTIETDWVSPEKVRKLEITGENGKFYLDYLNKTLAFTYTNGTCFEYCFKHTEPLELELTSFIKSVEANIKSEITGEDGKKAVYYAEKFVKG